MQPDQQQTFTDERLQEIEDSCLPGHEPPHDSMWQARYMANVPDLCRYIRQLLQEKKELEGDVQKEFERGYSLGSTGSPD